MNFHSQDLKKFKNDDKGPWAKLYSSQKLIPATNEKPLATSIRSFFTVGLVASAFYREANI
jgi:hypothetical protein